jgi:uracil-DNA glycosylase family 4
MSPANSDIIARLDEICREVVSCNLCPRLVEYRRLVAEERPKRYRGETYWAKPLPGFGDPLARIMVVGLAPAAHGGNRTGRMFTGDSSGNTLARALYVNGLASLPYSIKPDDGLTLRDVFLTASVRCVPPENKPLPQELENCRRYLISEFRALRNVKVIVALGAVAFASVLRLLRDEGFVPKRNRIVFRHGAVYEFSAEPSERRIYLLATYHPSRRNTQTGLLTPKMLARVFARAVRLAGRA